MEDTNLGFVYEAGKTNVFFGPCFDRDDGLTGGSISPPSLGKVREIFEREVVKMD